MISALHEYPKIVRSLGRSGRQERAEGQGVEGSLRLRKETRGRGISQHREQNRKEGREEKGRIKKSKQKEEEEGGCSKIAEVKKRDSREGHKPRERREKDSPKGREEGSKGKQKKTRVGGTEG